MAVLDKTVKSEELAGETGLPGKLAGQLIQLDSPWARLAYYEYLNALVLLAEYLKKEGKGFALNLATAIKDVQSLDPKQYEKLTPNLFAVVVYFRQVLNHRVGWCDLFGGCRGHVRQLTVQGARNALNSSMNQSSADSVRLAIQQLISDWSESQTAAGVPTFLRRSAKFAKGYIMHCYQDAKGIIAGYQAQSLAKMKERALSAVEDYKSKQQRITGQRKMRNIALDGAEKLVKKLCIKANDFKQNGRYSDAAETWQLVHEAQKVLNDMYWAQAKEYEGSTQETRAVKRARRHLEMSNAEEKAAAQKALQQAEEQSQSVWDKKIQAIDDSWTSIKEKHSSVAAITVLQNLELQSESATLCETTCCLLNACHAVFVQSYKLGMKAEVDFRCDLGRLNASYKGNFIQHLVQKFQALAVTEAQLSEIMTTLSNNNNKDTQAVGPYIKLLGDVRRLREDIGGYMQIGEQLIQRVIQHLEVLQNGRDAVSATALSKGAAGTYVVSESGSSTQQQPTCSVVHHP